MYIYIYNYIHIDMRVHLYACMAAGKVFGASVLAASVQNAGLHGWTPLPARLSTRGVP